MSELKRINIYMGIVGQAYVDKETAYKNLKAALKNVDDINEIIADAQVQLANAQTVRENAVAAQVKAQEALGRLNGKIDELNETDLLYLELNRLKDDLNTNDTDGNGLNGGNIITAQENIENIDKQIEELQSIIADAQESLVRRQEHVAECQEAYENAVEKFEGYLPADDKPSKFDLFDEEEEILKARIAAAVEALREAQLITDAINATSEDVIVTAISVILNVCGQLDAKLEDLDIRLATYKGSFNELLGETRQLKATIEGLEGVNEADKAALLSNLDSLIVELENDIANINTMASDVNDMFNINEDIVEPWEGNKDAIAEVFSFDYFNDSVQNISDLNGRINEVAHQASGLKNEISANRRELNRYVRQATYLENNMDVNPGGNTDPEPVNPEPVNPEPGTETNYYWYVGQDHPTTNNNIVDDTTLPGWRLTGTSLDADYSFNTTDNNIKDDPTRREPWYVALPVDTQYHLYDDLDSVVESDYITDETFEFNSVTYRVYAFVAESRAFGGITIKK